MHPSESMRPAHWLLVVLGLSLLLSGQFALVLSAMGKFLPHDEDFLGMTAQQLCSMNGCRIVHFMFHDRVSFGGALIAVGTLYIWLTAVPLRQGQAWAWWVLLVSCVEGFLSFFSYLGYGYLDTWHGLATLAILPCCVLGLAFSWVRLPKRESIFCLLRPRVPISCTTPGGRGRVLLLASSLGMIGAGLTIMTVGMTSVFVPQDLQFMDVKVEELYAINARLVPLIAHDRAGFGGAVCCAGLTIFFCVWCARPSRGLWIVLALAGIAGFSTAVGIHPLIGYNDFVHLAPAVVGTIAYTTGMVLTYRSMTSGQSPCAATEATTEDVKHARSSNA